MHATLEQAVMNDNPHLPVGTRDVGARFASGCDGSEPIDIRKLFKTNPDDPNVRAVVVELLDWIEDLKGWSRDHRKPECGQLLKDAIEEGRFARTHEEIVRDGLGL